MLYPSSYFNIVLALDRPCVAEKPSVTRPRFAQTNTLPVEDSEDDEEVSALNSSHKASIPVVRSAFEQLQRLISTPPTTRSESSGTHDISKGSASSSKYSAAAINAKFTQPSTIGSTIIDDFEFVEGPPDEETESTHELEPLIYAGPKSKFVRYRITALNTPQGGSKRPRKEVLSALFVTSQLPLHFK